MDTLLGRAQERKSESEAMYGLLDTEHGVVESYHSCMMTGFVDINRSVDAWLPLFDPVKEIFRVTPATSFVLHDHHEIYLQVQRLVPWRITRMQVARNPKANRWVEGLESPHRAAVLLHNDSEIAFDVVKPLDVPGGRQRFTKPVAYAIFIHGVAPAVAEDADVDTDVIVPSLKGRKVRASEEIWFEKLPATIPKAIQQAIARLQRRSCGGVSTGPGASGLARPERLCSINRLDSSSSSEPSSNTLVANWISSREVPIISWGGRNDIMPHGGRVSKRSPASLESLGLLRLRLRLRVRLSQRIASSEGLVRRLDKLCSDVS